MGAEAHCQTCEWALIEEDLTKRDRQALGEGGTGIWQAAVFHVYSYDDGTLESRHRVILLPSGMDVDSLWDVFHMHIAN